jgi:hypothetical protein
MTVTDRFDEDRFDRMLAQALQRHLEPTPADFTERMLTAVKQAEQQRILAGVVLQQRLALAASILFGAVTIVAVVFFPTAIAEGFRTIAGTVGEQIGMWLDRIPPALETARTQWQFYAVGAAAFGLAVYTLIDLFVGERSRIA